MRKISKYLLGLLFPILYPATTVEADNYLILTRNDGQVTAFSFNDDPKISFSEDDLNVKSTTLNVTLKRADVKTFQFSNSLPTSILALEDDNESNVAFREGIIYLSGLTPKESVKVCSLSGSVVMQQSASVFGTATVDATKLSKGVYVVRAGKSAVKVVNDKN